MKRFINFSILSFCFVAITAYAKPQYIPAQLKQFESSGICVGCDLSEADLPSWDNANVSGTLLVKSSLNGHFYTSNFSHAQIMYSNLAEMEASGSNFNSANFTGSNLSWGNFSSCDFTGANLSGADLSNADLARATISAEQLVEAKSLNCTIMPDGTKHAPDKGSSC